MTDVHYLSALELAAAIRAGKVSSVEATQAFIDRIEAHDGQINAVPVRTFEQALTDAAAADAALARGKELGPLHGVPMTIKESYVLANTPSTWGIESQRNNISNEDGTAVRRFRNAGAHFLGKTNVPTDLADFQSYNPIYGTTSNPWNVERTPGGSSGGSAASLAAGFAALEAGSDIGGSIRNPAHFCGVFGHKPTWGIVPMAGHELMPGVPDADLSVCGPLARSGADLEVALDVMAGPLPREAIGWKLDLPRGDIESLSKLRVAVWATDDMAPVDDEVAGRVQMVGETLSKLGATVSDSARPNIDPRKSHITYQTLLQSVMASAQPMEQFEQTREYVATLDPEDFSAAAVTARGAVLYHRDWIRYNFRREKLRGAWDAFFEDWDIVLAPQMATTAFPHDHRPFSERTITVNGREREYFEQVFWSGLFTAPLLPSTVFPTGASGQGLPIGVQAVSAPYRDHRTIQFAEMISREIGGFTPPPGF